MKNNNKLNKILKIVAIICAVTAIITLVLILNKGVIFGHRLVGGTKDKIAEVHNISAVAGRSYLIVDATTELYVNIDNEDVTDGYDVIISDEEVVSVENNKITGLKEGTATITIKSKEYGVSCEVMVSVVTPVTKLSIEGEFKTIAVNEECKIECVYTPENAKANIKYTVTDTEIATIETSEDGEETILTGKSKGTVTVIATDEISGKTASYTVEVK